MRAIGYVRSTDNNCEERVKRVVSFAKSNGIELIEIISDINSDGSYDSMPKAQCLIENSKDIVIIVSDTSDLYVKRDEDIAVINMSQKINDNNILLIDSLNANFDNISIDERLNKCNPSGFLESRMILLFEKAARMASEGIGLQSNKLSERIKQWENRKIETK